jgi:hypothetical protein
MASQRRLGGSFELDGTGLRRMLGLVSRQRKSSRNIHDKSHGPWMHHVKHSPDYVTVSAPSQYRFLVCLGLWGVRRGRPIAVTVRPTVLLSYIDISGYLFLPSLNPSRRPFRSTAHRGHRSDSRKRTMSKPPRDLLRTFVSSRLRTAQEPDVCGMEGRVLRQGTVTFLLRCPGPWNRRDSFRIWSDTLQVLTRADAHVHIPAVRCYFDSTKS